MLVNRQLRLPAFRVVFVSVFGSKAGNVRPVVHCDVLIFDRERTLQLHYSSRFQIATASYPLLIVAPSRPRSHACSRLDGIVRGSWLCALLRRSRRLAALAALQVLAIRHGRYCCELFGIKCYSVEKENSNSIMRFMPKALCHRRCRRLECVDPPDRPFWQAVEIVGRPGRCRWNYAWRRCRLVSARAFA